MNEDILKEILQQEKELQFTEFSNETALKIGLMIVDRAKQAKQAITVEIIRNDQLLFHYAMDGTAQDNDNWVRRKANTVKRFGHSALYYYKTFENPTQFYTNIQLDSKDCAYAGGAFPIIIKNTGIIGSVTVSGLTNEEDHAMVVGVIREYLSKL
jgi:uncharacterized protein (UPF0303 family)